MWKHHDEKVVCKKCGKEFIKRKIIYPCNCDDKRDSFYSCPHCGETYTVRAMPNEDYEGIKI